MLATRRVYLDHVRPGDFSTIYDLLASPDTGPVFQFRGRVPSPAEVQQHFWDDVMAHWIVRGARGGRECGLVTLGSADLTNGYAYLSAVATRVARGRGLLMEGIGLAVDYAFRTWPLRKLYAEVCEPSSRQFRHALNRFCVEEGRFRQHEYRDGAFHDMVTLAVYRTHWEAFVQRFGRIRINFDGAKRPASSKNGGQP